jgi:hypothetical protein
MADKKIRVAELAKELGLTNQQCLLLAQSMGISVKNISSSMQEPQANRVRRKVGREGLAKPSVDNSENRAEPKAAPKVSQTKRRDRWPLPVAYDDSLFDPKHWMASDDLKGMQVETAGPLGHSSIYQTGGFAVVAKARIGGEVWAIRLLYKQQADLEERYQVIHARQAQGELLDVMVPVEYRDDEIGVSGFTDRFPVILVKWVEGSVFNRFVENACRSRNIAGLKNLRSALADLEARMRELQLAHGDLSGDNMMVSVDKQELILKLLDYDSLWLPEIRNLKSSVGDGELQHPGVSKSSIGSIGPAADFVAFRMYDLGLQVLISNPDLGIDSACYEHRFLVTREEVINNSSDVTQLMRNLDEQQFDELVNALNAPYDQLLQRFSEMVASNTAGEHKKPGNTEDMTMGQLWTLESLVELWQLSVGEIRRLAARASITNDELSQGVSTATAARMAKSQDYVDLLRSNPDANKGVAKADESSGRIWVGEVANQFDIDLNFLLELSNAGRKRIDTASTITLIEADLMREKCASLISECIFDVSEIASRIGSVDVREIRKQLVTGRHRWVIRKDGRWLLDRETADSLVGMFPRKILLSKLADDLDLDLNFLVKLVANTGIQRDSASSIDEIEAKHLRSVVESMLRDCIVPLEDVVSKLDIKDEREIRRKFAFGRDLWVVKTGGVWMVGSSTAAKWARQYPPNRKMIGVEIHKIAKELSVDIPFLIEVVADVTGIRGLHPNSEITNLQMKSVANRISWDQRTYPVSLMKLAAELGQSMDVMASKLNPSVHQWVTRSYGVFLSIATGDELKHALGKTKPSQASKSDAKLETHLITGGVIASQTGSSLSEVENVARMLFGNQIVYRRGGMTFDSNQRHAITQRLAEDRKFPYPLRYLVRSGISYQDLKQMLNKSDQWVEWPDGIYIDLLTRTRLIALLNQYPAKNNAQSSSGKVVSTSSQKQGNMSTFGAIAAQTGSTLDAVLVAARGVLGEYVEPNRLFDALEREMVVKRLVENENKNFPYPLRYLVRSGISYQDLKQMLNKSDQWVERPDGIYIDLLTRTRLIALLNQYRQGENKESSVQPSSGLKRRMPFSSGSRKERVSFGDLAGEFALDDNTLRVVVNDVCRGLGIQAIPESKNEISEWLTGHIRVRIAEDEEKYPHRLEEIAEMLIMDLARLRTLVRSRANSLGNSSEHFVVRGYGMRLSEDLANSLLYDQAEPTNSESPKGVLAEKVRHWFSRNQCTCEICQKASKS